MKIQRPIYLKKLIDSRFNGMIKIVTGVRRCGKSYLLSDIFADWLKSQGVESDHIISINLEDRRNKQLRDPDALLGYIDSKLSDGNDYYVMIDEIQHVPEFEDVLNSYLHIKNVDVYVTGSNAKFLSKDVITTFRGRGYEIKVHPLCFSEFYPVSGLSPTKALRQHLTFGGLPQVVLLETDEQKSEFLKSLMEHTYIRDILERHNLKNSAVLDELLNILASSIGGLTNPTKLANTFESVKHIKVDNKTISTYLEYLCDSFIMERVSRYDIKGKKLIDSPYKYYFIDEGLRNARLNFRQIEFTHLLENLIYNELRIRGFNVDVGVVPIQRKTADDKRERVNLEVDFVCNLGSRRYYIQSAYRMPSEEKFNQEEASLRKIDDSFKKIIIVGEEMPVIRTEAGTTIMSIYDFLLKENSLEL
ncbi:MAG: ATP-binding protein [Muribaculaceae bacterium]|nr:ATP-binding protein [Muribaculaceae bacterium]